MLKKRIIPCLDVRSGRVVKGIKFENIRDVGCPVALAEYYAASGADELVFYDITASYEKRKSDYDFIKQVAEKINIPFTVGGGIKTLEDFDLVLKAGADKVSINSSAIDHPLLIQEASKKYGNQCVVVSMDVKRIKGEFKVFTQGGRNETDWEAGKWAKEAVIRGAGELVLNSIDEDGMLQGYDLELLNLITSKVNVPVIASGGAGSKEDFKNVFQRTNVDGALAASIFHSKKLDIVDLKEYLAGLNIPVRLL
ncbi:MAG: imidazole glycerol phosphate synthase subunit HisF [Clostridia bacterium]|nr:imidazole glycerol phosphate synthase subunit HisF [Clostridia bacterium]